MDPVDHVVADVHRVRAFRQQLHAEGVAIARGLERLVPPPRPLEERRADRLRGPAIHVVGDRFLRIAHARGRVDLLEAVAPQVALDHRRADRRGVIHVLQSAIAGAGIVDAGLVAAVGQFRKGVVFSQRHRVRRRRHAADRAREEAPAEPAARGDRPADLRGALGRAAAAAAPAAGRAVSGEGQDRVDFGVLRKRFRPGHVDRAACPVHAEIARPQARNHVVRVAQEEVRRVHEHPAVGFGGHREAPQNRLREGVLDRAALIRVGAVRAERVIGLHHHHPRPDPLEFDDPSLARLSAIDPDVVRPETRRKAGGVQHLGVELVDLHPEGSGLVIPVERHVAVQLLEAGRPRVDRLGRTRGLALAGAASLGENSGCGDQAQGYRKE